MLTDFHKRTTYRSITIFKISILQISFLTAVHQRYLHINFGCKNLIESWMQAEITRNVVVTDFTAPLGYFRRNWTRHKPFYASKSAASAPSMVGQLRFSNNFIWAKNVYFHFVGVWVGGSAENNLDWVHCHNTDQRHLCLIRHTDGTLNISMWIHSLHWGLHLWEKTQIRGLSM